MAVYIHFVHAQTDKSAVCKVLTQFRDCCVSCIYVMYVWNWFLWYGILDTCFLLHTPLFERTEHETYQYSAPETKMEKSKKSCLCYCYCQHDETKSTKCNPKLIEFVVKSSTMCTPTLCGTIQWLFTSTSATMDIEIYS